MNYLSFFCAAEADHDPPALLSPFDSDGAFHRVSFAGRMGISVSMERIADSAQKYRNSRELVRRAEMTVRLLTAAGHLSYERGRAAVVLRGPGPISKKNREFLDQRHSLADAPLSAVLAELATYSTESNVVTLDTAWNRVKALHALVDRDAGQDLAIRQSD